MSIRGSVEGGRFAPDAHDMERDIRLLLHRVRKPAELAANPLAQSIAAALGFSDPVVAIRKVVDEAFAGESHDDVAMRSLVLRCDIDGSLSLSEACRAFAYSRRHFQRYRAQAVGTIARFVTQLLDPSHATNSIVHPLEGLADVVADHDPRAAAQIYALETGPLPAKSELTYLRSRVRAGEQLSANDVQSFSRIKDTLALAIAAQSQEIAGNANDVTDLLSRLHYQASHASAPFDTATCFELEWLRFLQATHRSDTRALDASARALSRFAQEKPSLRPRALLAAAQASVHLGLLHDALDTVRAVTLTTYQERNVERLAAATLLRAKIELCANDAEQASAFATGAAYALDGFAAASLVAHATAGRARLLARKPWTPPDLSQHPRTAWSRLLVEAVHARHLFAAGDVDAATVRATSAYQLTRQLGYTGLVAYCAATLAACARERGDVDEANRLRVAGYAEFARTGDHLAAFDLFPAPVAFNDDLLEVVLERLAVTVPQLASDNPDQHRAVRACVERLCAYALGPDAHIADFDDVADTLNASNSALAHYFEKTSASIESMLAPNLTALVRPADRATVLRRLSEAMHVLETRVHPGAKRAFPVG